MRATLRDRAAAYQASYAGRLPLPDGTQLRFPPGVSSSFVVEILTALRSVGAC